MKKMAYFVGGVAVAVSVAGIAGSLTVPNSFSSGEVISSSEMNANFTAVKDAVDDNDGRITTNTTDIGNLTNRVDALESSATCPSDMVQVGPICVDKYEASVWDDATGGNQVTDLTTACNANGSDCTGIYARSVGNVLPATNITWFQAQQACANVGKRLLTNAEWQMAAAGTPDPGANTDPASGCNTGTGNFPYDNLTANTGASANCQSRWGVNDMIGNVNEWVADWVQGDQGFGTGYNAGAGYNNDDIHAAPLGTDANQFPAAVYRGGDANAGEGAGVFAFYASQGPEAVFDNIGFRCAK